MWSGSGKWDKDTAQISVAKLANGNIVMFPEDTREEVNILDMVGFINPGTVVILPPSTAITTVTADAGPDVSVESEGSTQIGDLDTITNPSGPTTYRWTRRSGTGGSLSSTTASQPTFTAPTVSSDRTIVWRKTTTNNGVSDTDDVTVTVTPAATSVPDTPSTPSVSVRKQTSLALSTTPGSGGAATLYTWRYSTNNNVTDSDPKVTSTGPSVTIPSLSRNTNYWIDVRAENSAGNSDYSLDRATSTLAATGQPVANRAPVAAFTVSLSTIFSRLSLNAKASSDPDNDSLTYTYRKISGPSVYGSLGTIRPREWVGLAASAAYGPGGRLPTSGTYVFEVTVSDGELSDSARDTITV